MSFAYFNIVFSYNCQMLICLKDTRSLSFTHCKYFSCFVVCLLYACSSDQKHIYTHKHIDRQIDKQPYLSVLLLLLCLENFPITKLDLYSYFFFFWYLTIGSIFPVFILFHFWGLYSTAKATQYLLWFFICQISNITFLTSLSYSSAFQEVTLS